MSGIYRDELAPRIRPFIHPAGLCVRRADLLVYGVSFLKGTGQDVGQNLSDVLTATDRPRRYFEATSATFIPSSAGCMATSSIITAPAVAGPCSGVCPILLGTNKCNRRCGTPRSTTFPAS